MRGGLTKARVLYVPVEEIGDDGRLLRACRIHFIVPAFFLVQVLTRSKTFFTFEFLEPFLEVIIDAFTEAGLVLEKDAKQKLKVC